MNFNKKKLIGAVYLISADAFLAALVGGLIFAFNDVNNLPTSFILNTVFLMLTLLLPGIIFHIFQWNVGKAFSGYLLAINIATIFLFLTNLIAYSYMLALKVPSMQSFALYTSIAHGIYMIFILSLKASQFYSLAKKSDRAINNPNYRDNNTNNNNTQNFTTY